MTLTNDFFSNLSLTYARFQHLPGSPKSSSSWRVRQRPTRVELDIFFFLATDGSSTLSKLAPVWEINHSYSSHLLSRQWCFHDERMKGLHESNRSISCYAVATYTTALRTSTQSYAYMGPSERTSLCIMVSQRTWGIYFGFSSSFRPSIYDWKSPKRVAHLLFRQIVRR